MFVSTRLKSTLQAEGKNSKLIMMKLNIHIAYCMCNTESQEKVHDFTSIVCIVYSNSSFILDADIVRKNVMGFVLCSVIRFI